MKRSHTLGREFRKNEAASSRPAMKQPNLGAKPAKMPGSRWSVTAFSTVAVVQRDRKPRRREKSQYRYVSANGPKSFELQNRLLTKGEPNSEVRNTRASRADLSLRRRLR